MSIRIVHEPPNPDTHAAPSSWAVMEARLATTKVHDLLDEASARLTRLAGEVALSEDVAGAVRETLQLVEAGRETIGAARSAPMTRTTTPQRSPG